MPFTDLYISFGFVVFRFNWILSACQGNTGGGGPGKGCGFYDQTPSTQQYKDMGTQVFHLSDTIRIK